MKPTMKNLFHIIISTFIGLTFLASCAADELEVHNPDEQLRKDSVSIRNFLVQEGKLGDFERDQKTGIWYEILTEGTGNYQYKLRDSLGSKWIKFNARVKYQGKLLNGTQFDSFSADTGVNFNIQSILSSYYPFQTNIIPAWVFALVPTKIDNEDIGGLTTTGLRPGTTIRLITPSFWAYGNSSAGSIPPNSPLDFTISILDIKDNRTVVPK